MYLLKANAQGVQDFEKEADSKAFFAEAGWVHFVLSVELPRVSECVEQLEQEQQARHVPSSNGCVLRHALWNGRELFVVSIPEADKDQADLFLLTYGFFTLTPQMQSLKENGSEPFTLFGSPFYYVIYEKMRTKH